MLELCVSQYIGTFPEEGSKCINWVELCSTGSHVTDGLTWKQLTFSVPDKTSDPCSYEGLLLSPATSPATPPTPLVVYPHGGPHSVTSADFLPWQACLAALGFTVLMSKCTELLNSIFSQI